jgi:Fe-S oxidoreductase
MDRPDLRPMRRLPTLEARRAALETCVFCPKLCRSACPVSNAEPTETLTPWGKMSAAYFVAHGDAPATESFTRTSLACTGCYACRELCDHRNDVAGTLLAARAAEASVGALPAAATDVAAKFPAHDEATGKAVRALFDQRGLPMTTKTALLVGCTYVRRAPDEAAAAVRATRALLGEPVALLEQCCGLPLLHAGDVTAFAIRAARVADTLARFARVVVVDPGCATALYLRYPEVGVTLPRRPTLLVELAAENVGRLTRAPGEVLPVRYHDPCQLGRGLGVYDAPRQILRAVTGSPPGEFTAHRDRAVCSGAGGLLPVTMPETSRAIAAARQREHESAGGGEIVTACASSLLALRKAGTSPVSDVVSWIARGLPSASP